MFWCIAGGYRAEYVEQFDPVGCGSSSSCFPGADGQTESGHQAAHGLDQAGRERADAAVVGQDVGAAAGTVSVEDALSQQQNLEECLHLSVLRPRCDAPN